MATFSCQQCSSQYILYVCILCMDAESLKHFVWESDRLFYWQCFWRTTICWAEFFREGIFFQTINLIRERLQAWFEGKNSSIAHSIEQIYLDTLLLISNEFNKSRLSSQLQTVKNLRENDTGYNSENMLLTSSGLQKAAAGNVALCSCLAFPGFYSFMWEVIFNIPPPEDSHIYRYLRSTLAQRPLNNRSISCSWTFTKSG